MHLSIDDTSATSGLMSDKFLTDELFTFMGYFCARAWHCVEMSRVKECILLKTWLKTSDCGHQLDGRCIDNGSCRKNHQHYDEPSCRYFLVLKIGRVSCGRT